MLSSDLFMHAMICMQHTSFLKGVYSIPRPVGSICQYPKCTELRHFLFVVLFIGLSLALSHLDPEGTNQQNVKVFYKLLNIKYTFDV